MNNGKKKIYRVFYAALLISILVLLNLFLAGKNQKDNLTTDGGEKVQRSAFMALNTDKSVYAVGEPVYLYASAIDEFGNTLCNCDVDIRVGDPEGEEIVLATVDGDISKSTACSEDGGKTNDPDYQSYFNTEKMGVYTIKIRDLNSNLTAQKNVEVKEDVDFDIGRYTTTRVNPSENERYHITLKVKAKNDFQGKVVDYFPSSFDIVWRGEAVVNLPGEDPRGTITWDVDLKAGEVKELKYDYKVTEHDPDIFSIGKINIMDNNSGLVFEEGNYWDLVVGKEIN